MKQSTEQNSYDPGGKTIRKLNTIINKLKSLKEKIDNICEKMSTFR